MPPVITIIIPVYDDADALGRTLACTDLSGAEVIVAATAGDHALDPLRARYRGIKWIEAPRGRARQMNAGAATASGTWLLFLHADTRLPLDWLRAIAEADADPRVAIGCFRFALDSSTTMARVLELGVRARVAVGRLPYGDQALFVRRTVFERLGGYADVPIMEDVDLVRRARRLGRLRVSRLAAVTSARRWERDGWILRTALHLRLIALYFAGVAPERLVRE